MKTRRLKTLAIILSLSIIFFSCKKDSNLSSIPKPNVTGDQIVADTPVIDPSLLCYLPFNGNLRDKSGHHNNGTLFGTLSYVADRSGTPGKAASFRASNSWIEIPEAQFVGMKTGTIALEFFPTSSGRQVLISKMSYSQPIGSPNFYQSFIAVIQQQNFPYPVQFNIRQSGYCNGGTSGWNPELNSTTNFALNQWNHLAITFNNSTQKMYINGNLVATTSKLTSPICQGEPIRVGVWWQSDPLFYTGDMDEVRIYNRVLSGKEIKALVSNSF